MSAGAAPHGSSEAIARAIRPGRMSTSTEQTEPERPESRSTADAERIGNSSVARLVIVRIGAHGQHSVA